MKTKILLTLTLLISANVVMAGAPAVPIDGGLSILLAIGAAFGLKKYIDHRKDQ